MMGKIGRNAPCPCGSGKKYKKCCLLKEQEKLVASRRKDETEDLFEDLPAEPAELWDETEAMEASAQSGLELEDEPSVFQTISDEVPEIGEEENALVDAWWAAYKGMKHPDKIIRHLDGFFQAHPNLVPNLELHHEVLFELGGRLVEAGRASDYIELLQRVRKDFPDAYLKSFSY